jgi:hypothetical protein
MSRQNGKRGAKEDRKNLARLMDLTRKRTP